MAYQTSAFHCRDLWIVIVSYDHAIGSVVVDRVIAIASFYHVIVISSFGRAIGSASCDCAHGIVIAFDLPFY